MTRPDNDSDVLEHGRWVRDPRTGVLRWHPDARPLDPADFACPSCKAAPGMDCQSRNGRPTSNVHLRRVDLVRKDAETHGRGAA